MGKLFFEIGKHLKIYGVLAKNSLMSLMEYRANLFASLTMELVYLASKILYAVAVYHTGISIKGVSPHEILIFIGTFTLMTAIYTGLFMDNFYRLADHIRNGTLDNYITKPVSLQFMATMWHVNFVLPIPNIIAGAVMIVMGCNRLHLQLSVGHILVFLLIVISGSLVAYAVFLAPQILAFWTVKSHAIIEIADRCWDFNNMPMNIYTKWMQRIGVFVIPVFFITNFPALFLVGKLNRVYAVWAIVAPVLLMLLVRQFWKFAIRNYTSASS